MPSTSVRGTSIKPGDVVNIEAISADAMQMSALEDVDAVAYRLEGDPANPTLVWLPEESSVGTHVLRPSAGMFAGGAGDVRFLLGAQYVHHWLNDRGGQWRSNVQVGYKTLLTTSLYQPFDVAQRYFVEPALFGVRSVEDVYVDGDRIAVYRFIDVGGSIDFGVNLGRSSQVRIGYISTDRRAEVQTGIATLPEIDARLPEIDARDAGLHGQCHVRLQGKEAPLRSTAWRWRCSTCSRTIRSAGIATGAAVQGGLSKAVPFGKNAIWSSCRRGRHGGR